METISLSTPGGSKKFEIGLNILFLAVLLDNEKISSMNVAATASRSNLFFTSLYGIGVKRHLGLKVRKLASE